MPQNESADDKDLIEQTVAELSSEILTQLYVLLKEKPASLNELVKASRVLEAVCAGQHLWALSTDLDGGLPPADAGT